jgi:ADP-ribosylglycohydrolase
MSKVRDAILGLVTGDALGVPVEFQPREKLKANPVTNMMGYGTYNQPPGTWSDDSSLALCLAEELVREYDPRRIAGSFVRWLYENHWTPHGEVFDVGNNTEAAIKRLKDGVPCHQAGSTGPHSNGNGALMRILPLLFHVREIEDDRERFEIIREVASITHAHIRSSLACFYYIEFARIISTGQPVALAYNHTNAALLRMARVLKIPQEEISHFERLTNGRIDELREEEVYTDTYVVYTLEAALWCVLNASGYQEAVIRAVNLGKDTDTTAAVTGGLAGLIYSAEAIPRKWVYSIARLADIEKVIERLEKKYGQKA